MSQAKTGRLRVPKHVEKARIRGPKNVTLQRPEVAKIFVVKLGLLWIDWAYEKESIPQVSDHLESFWMTYSENELGDQIWQVEKIRAPHSCDSSVGRASDWRSGGLRFNPGSRHSILFQTHSQLRQFVLFVSNSLPTSSLRYFFFKLTSNFVTSLFLFKLTSNFVSSWFFKQLTPNFEKFV